MTGTLVIKSKETKNQEKPFYKFLKVRIITTYWWDEKKLYLLLKNAWISPTCCIFNQRQKKRLFSNRQHICFSYFIPTQNSRGKHRYVHRYLSMGPISHIKLVFSLFSGNNGRLAKFYVVGWRPRRGEPCLRTHETGGQPGAEVLGACQRRHGQ